MSTPRHRRLRLALFGVLALPGLYQLCLLAIAVAGRIAYPYDLEWMEGGLLLHATRIAEGEAIYAAPSIDFIPYLYTPLYPALVAVLGELFGVSYLLGRLISVLSIVAILFFAGLTIAGQKQARRDPSTWCGVAIAAGLLSASYPFVDGWYDLVRADTLFLAMVLGGLIALLSWARRPGLDGQLRVAAAAAILAFSFFCKQTGVFYVAAGGVLLLFSNWRRVPIYVAVSGVIGLGGTYLLDRATGGWFWTYIFEVHQAHDFNIDRVWASVGYLLWKWFPLTTLAIALGLLAVLAAAITRRRLPPRARALCIWSFVYAVSCAVGAVGWGTQWAHFNAYIPALVTGAIAAGAAVPAILYAVRELAPQKPALSLLAGGLMAFALGAQLVAAQWNPLAFVPGEEDRRAGDRLVERLAATPGEIYVPFHPWYARLAGKDAYTHRMGLMDMRYGGKWDVAGLKESLRSHRFDLILLDNRAASFELPGLERYYRYDDDLPEAERPRVYSGAGAMWKTGGPLPPGYRRARKLVPKQMWVPAAPTPPPEGAKVLFDFEGRRLEGWTITGRAWGRSAVSRPLPRQGQVRRYGGRFFATSFHGGDRATGTLLSPPFRIEGEEITLRISGGTDKKKLRAELRVGEEVVKVATSALDSERMEEASWDVSDYRGREARIALIDQATGSWGHLNVDEIWLWK